MTKYRRVSKYQWRTYDSCSRVSLPELENLVQTMAIYHLSMKPISRSAGRSSVAAAAYRAGERIICERDGLVHDFTRKRGVVHSEIVLPEGSTAAWARDRSALWNAAEFAEKRNDARTAREFEIALPHELDEEQRIELVRDFCQLLSDRYRTAVDFAIHAPQDESDIRNVHAHCLMTTRQVGGHGLEDKTQIELSNRKLLAAGMPTSHMQLKDIRRNWEQLANRALGRAGHEVRIDHRSHDERGLEIEPTIHMGVHATQLERKGEDVVRSRHGPDSAKRNAEIIKEKPEQVLALITGEKSVFDRHDVARALHRYIDDPLAFQAAFAKVMKSDALVELQKEGPSGELVRYSTKEMVKLEHGMVDGAEKLAKKRDHWVRQTHVDRALDQQDAALRKSVGGRLSQEQRQAIRHMTGPERATAVVGFAGAGKSTALYAAREAWEAQGYRVHGAALAGKAAEGLEESSGIQSRTLASYEMSWQNGRHLLGKTDVMVIDEAGMISSRQLARFVGEIQARGAKVVMVGDPEQLQAIGAGAAFRSIAERIGYVSLEDVRRQREQWQQQASRDFAKGETGKALAAYEKHGAVKFAADGDATRAALVKDYMADWNARGADASRLALAHRRKDVKAINEAIREARQDRGELVQEQTYQTTNGKRAFAVGDRMLFTENNRDLGVKNGMLGTLAKADDGRLHIRLDKPTGTGSGRDVVVSTAEYAALEHGYAVTVHKSQGATVGRSFVYASQSMDRHIAYVAATRHKDGMKLYAPRDEFKDLNALGVRLGRERAKETTLDYDGQRSESAEPGHGLSSGQKLKRPRRIIRRSSRGVLRGLER